MNSLGFRRTIALLSAIALPVFVPVEARAETSSKVTAAEARAELAKAKAKAAAEAKKKAAKKEEPTEQPSQTSKPPRKRLFSGLRKKSQPEAKKQEEPPKPTTVKSETPSPKPQLNEPEEPERKKRFRLFKKRSQPEPKPPVASKPEEEKAEQDKTDEAQPLEVEEEPKKQKRFSLFRRSKKDAPEKTETESETKAETTVAKQDTAKPKPTTPEKSEPVEAESIAKEKNRKAPFGGLFAKKNSDKTEPEPEEAPSEKIETSAPAEQKKSRGSLFGIFKRDDSKGFAKADKTKLGKSLESQPEDASSVTVKKNVQADEGWFVITDSTTPFYAIGPGQPLPPEKMLDRGSMLTVTKGGWGWSNVRLGSGELGVVSSKAMRPATVAEIARHNHSHRTASKSRGSRRLFNILGRGKAPKPDLPTGGDTPIKNFGLLPPVDSGE